MMMAGGSSRATSKLDRGFGSKESMVFSDMEMGHSIARVTVKDGTVMQLPSILKNLDYSGVGDEGSLKGSKDFDHDGQHHVSQREQSGDDHQDRAPVDNFFLADSAQQQVQQQYSQVFMNPNINVVGCKSSIDQKIRT